jgi:hypothetical protein
MARKLWCWPSSTTEMSAKVEKLIASLRSFGKAHGEHIGVQPYIEWQKAFDPLLTPGARNYWKSHNFTGPQ